ncbi:MAG: DNA alkylation repair protein [Hyphomicrobiales bacterium]
MTHSNLDSIKARLQEFVNKDYAIHHTQYFQAFPGGYGEGDVFIGLRVPQMRLVSKEYRDLSFIELEDLITSDIHEYRFVALLILIIQFRKANKTDNALKHVEFYKKHIKYVNNWDLVDLSARVILGEYLLNKDTSLLYEYAKSDNLWIQRIAMLSTYAFIKNNKFEDAQALASIFLTHKHDLMHKAAGWMLREMGKKNIDELRTYLNENYKSMPRTMLRYAIERLPNEERLKYLKGLI